MCICPRRLITDNIMLAFEAQHFLKTKPQGKDGFATIKLDIKPMIEWSGTLSRLYCAEWDLVIAGLTLFSNVFLLFIILYYKRMKRLVQLFQREV